MYFYDIIFLSFDIYVIVIGVAVKRECRDNNGAQNLSACELSNVMLFLLYRYFNTLIYEYYNI